VGWVLAFYDHKWSSILFYCLLGFFTLIGPWAKATFNDHGGYCLTNLVTVNWQIFFKYVCPNRLRPMFTIPTINGPLCALVKASVGENLDISAHAANSFFAWLFLQLYITFPNINLLIFLIVFGH